MTLKELKKIIDKQYKKNKEGEIEFYLGDTQIEIYEMGRFGFVPDINIYMRKIKHKKIDVNNFRIHNLHYNNI
jgi:hypothetical protein